MGTLSFGQAFVFGNFIDWFGGSGRFGGCWNIFGNVTAADASGSGWWRRVGGAGGTFTRRVGGGVIIESILRLDFAKGSDHLSHAEVGWGGFVWKRQILVLERLLRCSSDSRCYIHDEASVLHELSIAANASTLLKQVIGIGDLSNEKCILANWYCMLIPTESVSVPMTI
jgi:hypothetical protein